MILGIGTDIIEIERVEQAISRTPAFLDKVYTKEEHNYFKQRKNRPEVLAGNFAVKEAVSKALGTGFRTFLPIDIEVKRDELGKPYVTLKGGAKELADKLGVTAIHVSISHCNTLAMAYVIVEGNKKGE